MTVDRPDPTVPPPDAGGPKAPKDTSKLPGSLIALSPGTLRGGRGFEGIARVFERSVSAAVRGGLRSLILREPFLGDSETMDLGLRVAAALRAGAGDESTWFGIHDRVHLAGALEADGVHLGGRSLPPLAAREVLGSGAVALGLSTHAEQDLGALGAVDYVFHSPVFHPTSKERGGGPPIGPGGLLAFAAKSPVKVWGLGGIDAHGIHALPRTANIAGAALIGALWGTDASPLESGFGPSIHGPRPGPLEDLAGIEGRAGTLAAAALEVFKRPFGRAK